MIGWIGIDRDGWVHMIFPKPTQANEECES